MRGESNWFTSYITAGYNISGVEHLISFITVSVKYVARPQSKCPTRPTVSKPYIARSDCAYVIEQWRMH
jgi:hypothetical protein